jgi:pimeloyl-ACP methyl ester carboxylesterase
MEKRRPIAALVLVLLSLALSDLPQAASAAPGRPDLALTSGAITVANGHFQGHFVVKNVGAGNPGLFHVAMFARVPGPDRKLDRAAIPGLGAGSSRTVPIRRGVPDNLPEGTLPLIACADPEGRVKEPSEANNCRRVGTLRSKGGAPGNPGKPGNGAAPGASPAPPASGPISSVPTAPIPFAKETVFMLQDPASEYWVYVPRSYDSTHQTPTKLFVWLHGCGGEGRYDIENVSPGEGQDWISIAVGGTEGGCWDPAGDQGKVTAAIADLKTHFNLDPKRVILGGYSSGGDLAYRMAFEHAGEFAGILVENTTPFRDTGLTQGQALAAASWKFNVIQVAHLQDDTYPIATVRDETAAMVAAGFPVAVIERTGTHYDEPGDVVAGTPVPGTDADVRTYLLPHIDDGWTAP